MFVVHCMNRNEIFFAIIPGWYFILRSHYFKGVIYFSGFAVVSYLSLFDIPFPYVSPLVFVVLIWVVSVIDSIVLHQQYIVNIDSDNVIRLLLKDDMDSVTEFPFYIVQFYNAVKNKNNRSYFKKMIKNLNNKDLSSDWQNLVHYYVEVLKGK